MTEEIQISIHVLAQNIGEYFHENEYYFIDEKDKDKLIDKIEMYMRGKNFAYIESCLDDVLMDCKNDIVENIKYNDLLSFYCNRYNQVYSWYTAIKDIQEKLR